MKFYDILSPSVNLISLVTFSISLGIPVKISLQGISGPPCRRSAENLLEPVTLQVMEPPCLKNDEQIDELLFGTWPTSYNVGFANGYSEQIVRVT